ncbi:MAG: PLP-dependent aminotransferase family protein [Eggerthellales bacterium]|nr:PLP-dependent aminotransferase family protein [Eggerthellales bacterium]
MITLQLDRTSGGKPLYTQIYEQIRELIVQGIISPGERLPSKKKLSEHLKVSVKTIENAYFQLALEGYVQSKEKVGYFANDITGFYTEARSERPSYTNRFQEDHYRLDIRANKTPTDMFPLSVWARIAREVMADEGRSLLETVPFNGIPELRIAIAEYLYGFRGMKVSPDQIVIGSGTEYLYQRLARLLGEDCVFGMEDPGYTHTKRILANSKVPYRCIPTDWEGMRSDALTASDCTVAHVSPMHHFPLGTTMPVQRRVQLLTWVNQKPGRYLIEDDYNSEYLYQGNPVPTLYSLDVRQKVIYINTFSKTLAPSLRLAYMVLPDELMDRYVETTTFYSCTVASSLQHQLARFISEGHFERHIHRVRQHNLKQRELVADKLEASPLARSAQLLNSPSGTHFLLRLATDTPDQDIYQALLEKGILSTFVSHYCEQPTNRFDHLLIMNYSSIDAEGIDLLFNELQAVLQS